MASCAIAPSSASLSAGATPLRSLWSVALERLPPPDQGRLQEPSASSSGGGKTPPPDVDLAALSALVAQRRDECQNGRWRFRFRGRDIILRDKAAKALAWLDRFKQVGDVAVKFDPHHAALPWAGVRLLLEESHEDFRPSKICIIRSRER
jgi:hypothetical protein